MQVSIHIFTESFFNDVHLTTEALARRWNMTIHTLEQWRWKGHGPRFLKVGSKIMYRQEEVEKFENTNLDAYTLPFSSAAAKDPRFLCIQLEGLTATQERERDEFVR